jgi:hypothetical protein
VKLIRDIMTNEMLELTFNEGFKSAIRNHVVGELLCMMGKPVDSALIDIVANNLGESIYYYINNLGARDDENESL